MSDRDYGIFEPMSKGFAWLTLIGSTLMLLLFAAGLHNEIKDKLGENGVKENPIKTKAKLLDCFPGSSEDNQGYSVYYEYVVESIKYKENKRSSTSLYTDSITIFYDKFAPQNSIPEYMYHQKNNPTFFESILNLSFFTVAMILLMVIAIKRIRKKN